MLILRERVNTASKDLPTAHAVSNCVSNPILTSRQPPRRTIRHWENPHKTIPLTNPVNDAPDNQGHLRNSIDVAPELCTSYVWANQKMVLLPPHTPWGLALSGCSFVQKTRCILPLNAHVEHSFS